MHPLVFSDLLDTIVFGVAVVVWYVPELFGALAQRAGHRASAQDRGSYAFLLATMFVGLFLGVPLAFVLPAAAITWNRPLLFWIGIACILLGVALRWYAIRTLGSFFTRDVAVQAQQTVVQTGPYHYIRHPAYSGTLLTLLGIGLALTNWVSLALILAGGLVGHLYRVRVEERALTAALGQPYADYMRRTKRFIPFLV